MGSDPIESTTAEPDTNRGSDPIESTTAEPDTNRGSDPIESTTAEPDTKRGSDPLTVTPHDPGVRPQGSDPVSRRALGTVRRIAEEEVFLVLLLAVFGVCVLLIFPPHLLVTDSWLVLAAGREVWEHGLPTQDEWTILAAGRPWTDQQWGAQLLAFGAQAVGGGHAFLTVFVEAFVFAAFVVAAAAGRSLGAGPRAIALVLFPAIVAAPFAWTIRAQVFALPLYTGLLWLLASEARRPSRRVYLAFPLLVVWANFHGSATLGALLTMLLGAIELVSSRGRSGLRSVLLLVLPPLAVLATPYGPVTTARYYHLLLVDPPFDRNVTEWQWADPDLDTLGFYVLSACALVIVALRWRRLRVFDGLTLALTFAGAVWAIRGIPWFALACMVFLPVAIGRALESKPAPVRRSFNRALTLGATAVLLGVVIASLVRNPSWYERNWPDASAHERIATAAGSDGRVFAATRYADWLLWKQPSLRGRVAYDVRFEILDPETFLRVALFRVEQGPDWKSLADGYDVIVLEAGAEPSSVRDFVSEPGARRLYRDDDIAVVQRPAS
jgi:hypothetical protein